MANKETLLRLEWRPLTANGSVWQLSLPFKERCINEPIAIAVKNIDDGYPWIIHTIPGIKGMQSAWWTCKPTNEQVLTHG